MKKPKKLCDLLPNQTKLYVGVCGVSSVDEAKSVISAFSTESGFSLSSGHIPMMGFQVSQKSLKRGFSEGNRRVPRLVDLPAILECVCRDTFPTIHYTTKEHEKLVPEVEEVLTRESIYKKGFVKGLQINQMLPTKEQVSEIKSRFPDLKITLQISPSITGGMTQQQVAATLSADYGNVEYVLLDASHGRGIEFSAEEITSDYRTFREGGVRSAIVFAGGFSGENVKEKLAQLVRATGTTNFSIDAEGGLRDKVGEGYGNDTLNLGKVRAYIKGAYEVLR